MYLYLLHWAYEHVFVAFGLDVCLRAIVFAFGLDINGSLSSRSKKRRNEMK